MGVSRGKNRPTEDRAELDQYWTKDVDARALLRLLPHSPGCDVLEPHAGGGGFVRAIKEVWGSLTAVTALDVDPDVPGLRDAHAHEVVDFLTYQPVPEPTWVIGNPPFSDGVEHVKRACLVTGRHVAFLLPLAFMETAGRIGFWREYPARHIWVLASRLNFLRAAQGPRVLVQQEGLFGCPWPDADVVQGVEDPGGGMSTPLAFYWWDRLHLGPTTIDPCTVLG